MSAPRSAYIHIPFCSHRCGYCNFTLVAGRDHLIPAFLTALETELRDTLREPRKVDTIFLGGGTPSHLPPERLQQLLTLVSQWLLMEPGGEFSCEVNPLDCDERRLRLLRQHGINRISLGGQSFNDHKLRRLERDHSGRQLSAAIERSAAVFGNLSLDLIFAAPEETLAEWQADIERALASPIRHLSTYGLTIERGSAFYGQVLRRQMLELDSELQLAMYEHAIDRLTAHRWQHYEVSNFAMVGFRCRHNEAYWLGAPWWAFGPGAASFLHCNQQKSFLRTVNHRSTTTYIRKQQAGLSCVAESEQLSLEDFVRERLVFGLRRLEGLDLGPLDRLWRGPALELFQPYVDEYVQRGWLLRDENRLRLTRAGLFISDSLWPDLLRAGNQGITHNSAASDPLSGEQSG